MTAALDAARLQAVTRTVPHGAIQEYNPALDAH
jgi:hypothetical protein